MRTEHSGIQAANQRFMDAVLARDVDGFVRLYTDDAILLLPGREPLLGKEGVRTFFASFEARGVREISLTTLEVEVFGETAWERGSAESKFPDGSVVGKAKYIVIWKQGVDGWKRHRDIINASA